MTGSRIYSSGSINLGKKGSRNFISAGINLLVLVLLTSSLSEPQWFSLQGGGCNRDYIGLTHLFHSGQFLSGWSGDKSDHYVYSYSDNSQTYELVSCLTPDIIVTLRTCLALVFLAILFTIIQIFLDLIGPEKAVIRAIQVNAVFSLVTVLVCVTIHGLCYWAAQLLQVLQESTRTKPGRRVDVAFSVGFYLIVGAAVASLLATTVTCFRLPLALHRERRRLLAVGHYADDLEVLLPPVEDSPLSTPCLHRPLPPTPASDQSDAPPAYQP